MQVTYNLDAWNWYYKPTAVLYFKIMGLVGLWGGGQVCQKYFPLLRRRGALDPPSVPCASAADYWSSLGQVCLVKGQGWAVCQKQSIFSLGLLVGLGRWTALLLWCFLFFRETSLLIFFWRWFDWEMGLSASQESNVLSQVMKGIQSQMNFTTDKSKSVAWCKL